MTTKTIIRHAIEHIYGPCPIEDFQRANAWAEGIDWEKVKARVEEEHPEFEWTHHDPREMEIAEAMIFDVRHDMLKDAGSKTRGT